MPYKYPQDDPRQARPDLDLTAVDIDLVAAQNQFVGQEVLPDLVVTEQRGVYPAYKTSDYMEDAFKEREPYGAYNRNQPEFSDKEYTCRSRGFEVAVDEQLKTVYKSWLDLEIATANMAQFQAAFSREKRSADIISNQSNYDTITAAAHAWSDADNATPIEDVAAMVETVGNKTGCDPDLLVISKRVYVMLQLCAEIQDAVKGEGSGAPATPDNISAPVLAKIFGVPNVLVAAGRSKLDTVSSGTETRTYPRMYGNDFASLIVRRKSTAGVILPHWGSRVVWDPGMSMPYAQQTGQDSYSKARFCSYYDPTHGAKIIQANVWDKFYLYDKKCAGMITWTNT